MSTLFVIVDFQNDFVSGTLAVPDAEATLAAIIKFGGAVEQGDGKTVVTRDWHPSDHSSFALNGPPTYEDGGWPEHCVQDTWGAEFHPEIVKHFPEARVFSKGQNPDEEQYSGYLATDQDGVLLSEYAHRHNFDYIAVAGLALDFCVKWTTFDFWQAGYPTTLILDGTRPVSYLGGAKTLIDLAHYDQGELYLETADEAGA